MKQPILILNRTSHFKVFSFLKVIFFLIVSYSSSVHAQNVFSVNFTDTSTYNITCGTINTSQWSVKNDSCVLYSPFFRKETNGCQRLHYDLTINQSGNMDADDKLWFQYQIDRGAWLADTILLGSNYNAVHLFTDSVSVCFEEVIRFRIIMKNNSGTEFWSIKKGGLELSGSFVKYPTYPGFGLPVELVEYKIKCTSTGSLFTWATASEMNNDYFTIEKTEDLLDWKILTTINGAFNSNNEIEYSSIDTAMVPDKTIFYRLKQTDTDGQFKYFDVLSILCSFKNDVLEIIGINASENGLNLIIKTNGLKPVQVYLSDISGKLISQKEINPVKGANVVSIQSSGLSKGIYIANLQQDGKSVTKKIYLGTAQ